MKILKREKIADSKWSNSEICLVIDGKRVSYYNVAKGELWRFTEVVYFEMKDPETGADMISIGLSGLEKKKS